MFVRYTIQDKDLVIKEPLQMKPTRAMSDSFAVD